MKSSSLTLSARFVFPVEGPPIADGCLTIQDGRIAWVGSARERVADLDLGNVAIVPGFVNAHTHLELSALEGPNHATEEPEPVEDEVNWLHRVVEQRRSGLPGVLQDAVGRNVEASIRAGTTSLADTTTAGLSWDQVAEAPLRAVVFAELIGLKRARGLQTSAEAWDWIGSIRPEAQVIANARPGLSPHAPYSTAGWLYHKAAASRLPLSTHLAEMPEELELLERGSGALRTFLETLGAWDEEWEPISPRPADYVRRGELRNADWLIAHGTYLEPSEFWQFRPEAAPNNHRVAIAFCPRTHARFGHAPHPYRAMLERGVVVCLGTDSLASSPTLSVLDEIRFLHRRDDSLNGPLLLTMGTLFGAWALRAETTTGSLKVGKSADLAVIDLPDREDPDPHHLLLESDLPVAATMFEGKFVSGAWNHF
ncbi:amidohydrolase family protein [Singulisphaera acidiphila]|uniref:Cytosine deaminase-like metal-dependent hydrolase n=1 Tax=Singulisphaera acidiphila (strain ATCC BAA-1392 / DSM 18658 / VKM B-2454 / MOB10) TaxID=886293 RepID=L0DNC3_SINAD|nr:amidohydrolase family protein [Singulisphaera acidiphila]AGA30181.1 cytosine deaminase-like metal-dependent hydrolase [Singulisphaera acidiphila DSM 18658]